MLEYEKFTSSFHYLTSFYYVTLWLGISVSYTSAMSRRLMIADLEWLSGVFPAADKLHMLVFSVFKKKFAFATVISDQQNEVVLLQDEPKPSSSRQSPRNSDSSRLDFLSMPSRAFEKAEELARRVWAAGWMVVHHNHLPKWLRDNDFLVKGHRPPMNSYWKCFKSVFRVHTETGNIWTHLLGMAVTVKF